MNNIIIKKDIEIIITPQAQKIIQSSKYNIDDFIDWIVKKHISFGGNDAALFLEYKFNEESK